MNQPQLPMFVVVTVDEEFSVLVSIADIVRTSKDANGRVGIHLRDGSFVKTTMTAQELQTAIVTDQAEAAAAYLKAVTGAMR